MNKDCYFVVGASIDGDSFWLSTSLGDDLLDRDEVHDAATGEFLKPTSLEAREKNRLRIELENLLEEYNRRVHGWEKV